MLKTSETRRVASPALPHCNISKILQKQVNPGGPGGPGLGYLTKRTVNIIDDGDDEPANNSSKRRPSVTLGFMLMKQLQFLAMLSLVESIVSRYSWFGNFVRGLR